MSEVKKSGPSAGRAPQAGTQSDPSLSEQWERVKKVFVAALEHEPGDRRAGDFLEKPVLADAGSTESLGIRVGTLAIGELLSGRFRVIRFLGRGGMGEVYEAKDLDLGECVALKTIRPEIASRPHSLKP